MAWPRTIRVGVGSLLLFGLIGGAWAQSASPQVSQRAPVWDTLSDTWSATDALGRKVPTYETVGPPRPDRYVGVFYFLWLGSFDGAGPFDVTRITEQDPTAMSNPASPLWGPMFAPHHWGQSLFGYYLNDDEFVLRRHAQMLSDAGVDVIIFDVTNNLTYKSQYMKLLQVFSEIRAEGGKTPQVAFLCPFGYPVTVVRELYRDLYGPRLYPDLWFRWRGKPLIMADPAPFQSPNAADAPADSAIASLFTFRKPQPSYFEGPTKPDMWSWLEVYPQHVFQSSDGRKEQMSVGVAQNAVDGRLGSMSEPGAHGRNWHDGKNDESPGAIDRGYNFQEQAERALKEDPEFVFVTGWNEWIAGRFPEFNGIKAPVMFVDEYNEEFSRDIEPMVGGHGDNYYYQLVSFIRRYKGARKPPGAGPMKTIDLMGSFTQWNNVQPEFRDDRGDTVHRNHAGWNKSIKYVNDTGRNDFVSLKVSRDRTNVYFYVQTKEAITPRTDPHWMRLFIDVDGAGGPNWNGFQFVVNRQEPGASTAVLERSTGGWNWIVKDRIRYRLVGNQMELCIPRVDLGLSDLTGPVRFDFKWADNMQHDGEIMDFEHFGDAAPNGRFRYRYIAPSADSKRLTH